MLAVDLILLMQVRVSLGNLNIFKQLSGTYLVSLCVLSSRLI